MMNAGFGKFNIPGSAELPFWKVYYDFESFDRDLTDPFQDSTTAGLVLAASSVLGHLNCLWI